MAIKTIRLPDVGEGVTEAEVAEILVKIGDFVREDDPIAAVMTDKATVEITSAYGGTVVWIGGEVGKTLAIGSDLIRIEDDASKGGTPEMHATADSAGAPPVASAPPDDALQQEAENEAPAQAEAEPPAAAAHGAQAAIASAVADANSLSADKSHAAPRMPDPMRVAPVRPEGAAVLASPAVRQRAREAGIDLRRVAGTGPAGRITHSDLDQWFDDGRQQEIRPGRGTASPSQPSEEIVETVKVTGLRRMIARRMSEANAAIPHITVVEEVDVTEIEALRARLNETRGDKPKLTLLPLVAAALVKARETSPKVFARYDDEADQVFYSSAVHIGIATMTDGGLMVPVLRHAQDRSLFDMAGEITRLSDACRSNKAKREELSGSTITITSLGPLGAIATTPIINKPEVAILGINRMAMRPSWNGSAFVPRMMMNISASFDHRIIDGFDAAVFVQKMKTLLETPALIFMKD
ncbi:dihydrolipoamide acetyltransferase family protein [Rhizobium sp. SSA_523]|uniref:dihydrolipoamide acetyltransferase family protein n=1 Tax=Rhizobium sp. SSA_523 TaxID=2952477 RepID=UPI002090814A|nr:dihydrolipoamide acetyltransferase family protein [Rhizobium sp. SSA_523]MCO5732344.1 2-oxo acid dehydrogenase subunit E2 [Rhizobium sp. SSA_523]WKC21257.1 dihydrolipoamide acetyltransferase family protein [Rhizobium sp. SSA_523]